MADYYLDLETYSTNKCPDWSPDFHNDKIISIAYQQFDSRTGEIKSPLTILKEWESSEQSILSQFHSIFFDPKFNGKDGKWNYKGGKWEFVIIGYYITSFDLLMLISRWNHYQIGIKINVSDIYSDRVYYDLSSLGFLCNGGRKPISLERLVGKHGNGRNVPIWYEKKDYMAIESYIKEEAELFIKFYAHLISVLPNIWIEFGKTQRFVV